MHLKTEASRILELLELLGNKTSKKKKKKSRTLKESKSKITLRYLEKKSNQIISDPRPSEASVMQETTFWMVKLHHRELFIKRRCVVRSDQIRSVAQLCPTLCNPMNRSPPGLPVHHQLLEFTETYVHRVSDAIQPSHSLLSPSPLPPTPPSIRVFSNESTLRMRWPKYWSFSFSIILPKKSQG